MIEITFMHRHRTKTSVPFLWQTKHSIPLIPFAYISQQPNRIKTWILSLFKKQQNCLHEHINNKIPTITKRHVPWALRIRKIWFPVTLLTWAIPWESRSMTPIWDGVKPFFANLQMLSSTWNHTSSISPPFYHNPLWMSYDFKLTTVHSQNLIQSHH
jgi:hypothetical protein